MNLSRHLHSGTQGQRLLRAALLGNAAFSALSAACLLLLPDDIIALAGFPLLHVRAILAYILLPYAGWLVSIVLKRDIKLGHARIVVGMDIAWTALSIPVAMFSPLTAESKSFAATASSRTMLNRALARLAGVEGAGAATINLPFLLRFTAASFP